MASKLPGMSRKARVKPEQKDADAKIVKLFHKLGMDRKARTITVEKNRHSASVIDLGKVDSLACFIDKPPSLSVKPTPGDPYLTHKSTVVPNQFRVAFSQCRDAWTAETAYSVNNEIWYRFGHLDADGNVDHMSALKPTPKQAFSEVYEKVFHEMPAGALNAKLFIGCHHSALQEVFKETFKDDAIEDPVVRAKFAEWMKDTTLDFGREKQQRKNAKRSHDGSPVSSPSAEAFSESEAKRIRLDEEVSAITRGVPRPPLIDQLSFTMPALDYVPSSNNLEDHGVESSTEGESEESYNSEDELSALSDPLLAEIQSLSDSSHFETDPFSNDVDLDDIFFAMEHDSNLTRSAEQMKMDEAPRHLSSLVDVKVDIPRHFRAIYQVLRDRCPTKRQQFIRIKPSSIGQIVKLILRAEGDESLDEDEWEASLGSFQLALRLIEVEVLKVIAEMAEKGDLRLQAYVKPLRERVEPWANIFSKIDPNHPLVREVDSFVSNKLENEVELSKFFTSHLTYAIPADALKLETRVALNRIFSEITQLPTPRVIASILN